MDASNKMHYKMCHLAVVFIVGTTLSKLQPLETVIPLCEHRMDKFMNLHGMGSWTLPASLTNRSAPINKWHIFSYCHQWKFSVLTTCALTELCFNRKNTVPQTQWQSGISLLLTSILRPKPSDKVGFLSCWHQYCAPNPVTEWDFSPVDINTAPQTQWQSGISILLTSILCPKPSDRVGFLSCWHLPFCGDIYQYDNIFRPLIFCLVLISTASINMTTYLGHWFLV